MAYVSLDSDQIKKANKKHKYSKEQVEQLENVHHQLLYMDSWLTLCRLVREDLQTEMLRGWLMGSVDFEMDTNPVNSSDWHKYDQIFENLLIMRLTGSLPRRPETG